MTVAAVVKNNRRAERRRTRRETYMLEKTTMQAGSAEPVATEDEAKFVTRLFMEYNLYLVGHRGRGIRDTEMKHAMYFLYWLMIVRGADLTIDGVRGEFIKQERIG